MRTTASASPRIPTMIELFNFAPAPPKDQCDTHGRPMLIIGSRPAGWAMAALSRQYGHGEFDLDGATKTIGRERRRTYDMIVSALEHGLIELTRSGKFNWKFYRIREEAWSLPACTWA